MNDVQARKMALAPDSAANSSCPRILLLKEAAELIARMSADQLVEIMNSFE